MHYTTSKYEFRAGDQVEYREAGRELTGLGAGLGAEGWWLPGLGVEDRGKVTAKKNIYTSAVQSTLLLFFCRSDEKS